ncbi:haloacid dehalogenase type II [soil metagenome]
MHPAGGQNKVMTTARRPEVVAFDVNETLVSLEPVRRRLVEAGERPEQLELFFARTLQHGFALTCLDEWLPFRRVAAAALRQTTTGRLDDGQIEHVLAAFGELPPYQDVAPAFERLAGAGVRIVTLTHGPASTATAMLERTGLDRYVEAVLTGESVRSWKPPRAPYLYAAATCGVAPEWMALVAAHAWDCHGARRAGLVTGWVSRLEGTVADIYTPADVVGDTLVEVADGLLALP